MKLEIPNQYKITIEAGCNNILITQEANGYTDEIWLSPDNAERFCAMVMECARVMLKGEVKGDR